MTAAGAVSEASVAAVAGGVVGGASGAVACPAAAVFACLYVDTMLLFLPSLPCA